MHPLRYQKGDEKKLKKRLKQTEQETDILIAENFNRIIKTKYKTVSECSIENFDSQKYLTNTISKIRRGLYPSIPRIKELAKICDCEFTEFFNI